jgi:hypothetical protein
MKKVIAGWVLLLLGAFLLTTALMMWFWAPGKAERTPLDSFSNVMLSGAADKLNPKTGKVEHVPVWVLSQYKTDSEKSDDNVIVFVNAICANIDRGPGAHDCLTDKDPRMITDDLDVFATDRHTALALGSNASKYGATPHEGLLNKWPFDAQKKDYPYWDSVLGKAVTASYASTEDIQGLQVYKYTVSIPPTKAEIVKGIEGLYSMEKEIWIEPQTGAIIDQRQHEIRTLPDGSTVLDMDVRFTPETVNTFVKDAHDNKKSLDLFRGPVPILLFVAGVICVVVGFILVTRQRVEPEPAQEEEEYAEV